MGWVGYFEDNWDRLQETITRAEEILESPKSSAELVRREGRQALGDARTFLAEIHQQLEFATAPEMNLAQQIQSERIRSFTSRIDLQMADRTVKQRDSEIASLNVRIKALVADARRLESEKEVLGDRIRELESPKYWRQQIEKYLSDGAIAKNRGRRK